jgi:hypothetical protein
VYDRLAGSKQKEPQGLDMENPPVPFRAGKHRVSAHADHLKTGKEFADYHEYEA